MELDPCGICGSPVRVEQRDAERRLGDGEARKLDVRVCESPSCRSHGSARRLGDVV